MAEPTKVLVTGGAGFIGSHLVTGLLENSYAVVIVDNLSSGHLRDVNHQATFYHAEINDPKIDQIIQRERPEIVFHLAAQSSVRRIVYQPGGGRRLQHRGHRAANICLRCSRGRKDRFFLHRRRHLRQPRIHPLR